MDIYIFLTGVAFLLVGLLMFYITRKEEPASEENNWTGMLPETYTRFKLTSFLAIFVGLAFIIKSL